MLINKYLRLKGTINRKYYYFLFKKIEFMFKRLIKS